MSQKLPNMLETTIQTAFKGIAFTEQLLFKR